MVNSISSTHTSPASEAAKPAAAPKLQPQPKTSPKDTVTLKSAGGDANHDGDNK
jgi:hypothetical protein